MDYFLRGPVPSPAPAPVENNTPRWKFLSAAVGPTDRKGGGGGGGDVYTCFEIPCTFHINSPNEARESEHH